MMCTIYRVHPTGVGMIRGLIISIDGERCSSHRRGNDSSLASRTGILILFIPQAWEWFDTVEKPFFIGCVHPTGVGMIRVRISVQANSISSSHRRGNDSFQVRRFWCSFQFIPQAWEWFVGEGEQHGILWVHPTGVGMIRNGKRRSFSFNCSSHRRGKDS